MSLPCMPSEIWEILSLIEKLLKNYTSDVSY